MKKLLFLLFLTIFSFAVILVAAPRRGHEPIKENSDVMVVRAGVRPAQVQDPPGTINGSQHPELIPDRAAFTILFLVLANRTTREEQIKARAYLNRFDPILSESDVLGLIAAADEYHQRVSIFNRQAKVIKDRSWPNPDSAAMATLHQLQVQKDNLIDEVVRSLHLRVSPSGFQTITREMLPYIKSKTKLAPEPSSLPGGPDWKRINSHH